MGVVFWVIVPVNTSVSMSPSFPSFPAGRGKLPAKGLLVRRIIGNVLENPNNVDLQLRSSWFNVGTSQKRSFLGRPGDREYATFRVLELQGGSPSREEGSA